MDQPASGPRRQVLLALAWYDAQLHRGIARFARQAGWVLDNSMARDGMAPRRWRGDGVIGVVGDRFDIRTMVASLAVPMVDLAHHAVDLDLPRVLPDNQAIGRLGAEHLLDRGYTHLAFYAHADDWVDRERGVGFALRVALAGHTATVLHGPGPSSTLGRAAARRLGRQLTSLGTPLGVMAAADHTASVVLEACDAAGLRVPEQVAVLGVNNNEFDCEFARVPLSSVDAGLERLGYEGSAMLDRLMRGQPTPRSPTLVPPGEVVTRRSTDIVAIDHMHVASAVRFIRDHFAEPITAADVVAAVPMSRAALYRVFGAHVGRSIAEEIARQRVHQAKQLLRETDAKVHEVAARCGFGSVVSFSRAFHRITGKPPGRYRRLP